MATRQQTSDGKGSKARPPRGEHVEFCLVNEEATTPVEADVIVRDSEMVVDATDENDERYVLIGKLRDGVYFAEASTGPPYQSRAQVAWAKIGPCYVGRWLEAGEEYLFTFRLAATSPGSVGRRDASSGRKKPASTRSEGEA